MRKTKTKPRKYTIKEKSIEPFENGLEIEKFLPSLRSPRNEKLRKLIVDSLYKLEKGESFFIRKDQLHVGTIRKIVLPELKKREFKDKEIRIVVNKKHELEGCRVGRYI
jgi:translation elongation factor EF-4